MNIARSNEGMDVWKQTAGKKTVQVLIEFVNLIFSHVSHFLNKSHPSPWLEFKQKYLAQVECIDIDFSGEIVRTRRVK